MDTQITDIKTENIDLFGYVYTQQDLMSFYKEIDQIMTHMFMGNGNVEKTLDSILSPEKKTAILSYLKQEKVRMENPVDVKVALSNIQKMGNTLPVVKLKLAFEPTGKIIKNISYWFTRRLGQKVILDFSLERHAIGGAFISFGGLYKDYTIKTKIDKYFDKQIA